MILTDSQSAADHVRRQLTSSFDWVRVALSSSIDPIGRAAGGEQPILQRDHGDARLESAVFQLPANQVSRPIKLPRGWAVIEVLRRYPAPDVYTADRNAYHLWLGQLRHQSRVASYLPLPSGS
jgi:parvulin-like peptidyl-prolyl isomerase